jgi:hypothetical protein
LHPSSILLTSILAGLESRTDRFLRWMLLPYLSESARLLIGSSDRILCAGEILLDAVDDLGQHFHRRLSRFPPVFPKPDLGWLRRLVCRDLNPGHCGWLDRHFWPTGDDQLRTEARHFLFQSLQIGGYHFDLRAEQLN